MVAYAALMMAVALVLPHRNTRWYELLPGVVLVAVGAVGMQILTSYYIVPRLQSASDTYGALGGATVVLLWLYLLSRLIVASAVVNANHWARRHRVDLDAGDPASSPVSSEQVGPTWPGTGIDHADVRRRAIGSSGTAWARAYAPVRRFDPLKGNAEMATLTAWKFDPPDGAVTQRRRSSASRSRG